MGNKVITENFIRRVATLIKLGRPMRYSSFARGSMRILNYLHSQPEPVCAGELSDILDASSARVAAVLRSLEGKGYIARSIDSRDRRKVLVHITEAGEKLIQIRNRELDQYFAQIVDELGEEDAREGLRILDRIIEIAERLEKVPDKATEVNSFDE